MTQLDETIRKLVPRLIEYLNCHAHAPAHAPPHELRDLDAEHALLAGDWLDILPARQVEPIDFVSPLHRALAEVLTLCRSRGIRPTIGLVLRGLPMLGIRGPHLEVEVRRLLEGPVVALEPERSAHRVRALAFRRRLIIKLDRLRMNLLDTGLGDEVVETAIDEFVETAAAQPMEASP